MRIANQVYKRLEGARAMVILSESLEYRKPDLEPVRTAMARPVTLDSRSPFEPARPIKRGFHDSSNGRFAV